MTPPIRIVVYGLGPVGCSLARELSRRPGYEIVGAVDRDPAKAGRDLGELLGLDQPLDLPIRGDAEMLLHQTAPELVLLATTSSLRGIAPQIHEIVERGANVLTTCEELGYPWATQPALACELDAAAQRAGVSVLATGVNPGFLMDYLPATVSKLCREVERITVERRIDAARRRAAFVKKIGAGLSLDAFRDGAARGTLRHVGLRESVHMIADALGWGTVTVDESIDPVIAREPIATATGTIETGAVCGIEQIARGSIDGAERIVLRFRAALGEPAPGDRLRVDGTPPIDLRIEGGVHGDLATCNVVVNSIPAVLAAAPGLHTMLDLTTHASPASRGSVRALEQA